MKFSNSLEHKIAINGISSTQFDGSTLYILQEAEMDKSGFFYGVDL